MLPEGCRDCPICGCPMQAYEDYCHGCRYAAMKRLGYGVDEENEVHGLHSEHAYWRVPGLLATWAKAAQKRRAA